MNKIDARKLLKNRLVQEEIARHRWIESEKAGFDIGFERAAEDWIHQFAEAWIRHQKANSTLHRNQSRKKSS